MTELTKENMERRAKYECTKLDTFSNIAVTLSRIEAKVDDLSDEMRVMIKLEQQVLTQSKDIERLNTTIDLIRTENRDLANRLLELRSNFETQKQSLSTIERVGWAVATCGAVLIGKYLFGIG